MSDNFALNSLEVRQVFSRIAIVVVSATLALGTIEKALQPVAIAHGVDVTYQSTAAIELFARFEGGVPMADAQVSVYAPNEPAEPWLQGKTDADGRFAFIPDADRAGVWQVRVRQAGHGKFVSIPMDNLSQESQATAEGDPGAGYTLPQKLVMGGLGVWGAVGTALYFSRNPRKEI